MKTDSYYVIEMPIFSDFELSKLKVFPNRWIVFCDLCGAVVWFYAIIKVFFLDVDALIISPLGPEWIWVSDFRAVIFLAVLATVAFVVGRKRFMVLCLYVLAFPLILLGWKFSFLLIRSGSWVLGISFINWLMSVLSDFRYKIIMTAVFVSSSSLVVFGGGWHVVITSMAILVAVIVAVFVRMVVNSFRAPRVLSLYRQFFGFLARGRDDFKAEEAGPRGVKLTRMPEEGQAKYAEALRMRILLNRGALFFATRLRDFQKSPAIALAGLGAALNLIVFSVVSFAVLYAGAERLNPDSISNDGVLEAFDFIYLSFSTMIFSAVDGVVFVDNVSRGLSMIQRFLSFTMLGLFLGVFLSVRSKKYQQELEDTIEEIKGAGKTFENSIVNYYGYSGIDEAVEDLRHLQEDTANFIVRLSASINP